MALINFAGMLFHERCHKCKRVGSNQGSWRLIEEVVPVKVLKVMIAKFRLVWRMATW